MNVTPVLAPASPRPILLPTMKEILAVAIAAVVVLLLVLSQQRSLEGLTEKERLMVTSPFAVVGEEAPEFSLPTLAGGTVSLSQYRGKPIILDFWTTWCSLCRKEFPLLETLYRSHSDQVCIVAVCSGTSTTDAARIVDDASVSFPVLYDDGKVVARAYQPRDKGAPREILIFPFTAFIDAHGTVVYARAGAFSTLDDLLDVMRRLELPID